MPSFRCSACGAIVEARIPPIVCRSCQARGKYVDASATVTADAIAAPQPAIKSLPSAVAAPEAVSKTPTELPPNETPERLPSDRIAWRFSPQVESVDARFPMRSCAAMDGKGRVFAAFGRQLVMLDPGASSAHWTYSTGGPIPRSPAIGLDGNIRVHSTDGYLHLVSPEGNRVSEPALVGPPLGWAMPLVDDRNRTWIARSDGGLVSVDSQGCVAKRPFYRTRKRFDCTGIIVDGILYIGSEDHFVHAVDLAADRGGNQWSSDNGAGRTGCPISCPIVVGPAGEILAISQDDHLYAFRRDGSLSWTIPLPGQVLGSPIVALTGAILIGISQTTRNRPVRGLLLAIDGATRQARWQVETDAPVESTPVIGDDGRIYLGDNAGVVYSIDANGKVLARDEVGSAVRSAGVILAPQTVAFGLEDGSLVAIRCSSNRISNDGWPKFQKTLAQSGSV